MSTVIPDAPAAVAPAPATPTRLPWWAPALICAAAFAAYHNSFHGPFVFDDESSIVTNPTIRTLAGALSPPANNVTAQGRPVLNLSLALNHAIGGTAVEGYHTLNLVIHVLAGLTLFGIVRRTLPQRGCGFPVRPAHSAGQQNEPVEGPPQNHRLEADATPIGLAVAVLWIVHPLQTESVTYIIQRAESLMGLFYLLTIYCFVRGAEAERISAPSSTDSAGGARAEFSMTCLVGEQRGSKTRPTGWFALAVIACAGGMATKEVMATAPLMVLFFDRTLFAGTFLGGLRRRPVFYPALASTWLLLGWLVVQAGGNRGGSVGFGVGVPWWEYWLTQFTAIPRYLWLTFWPHPLVFEYGGFWVTGFAEIAFGVALVVALLGATVLALWRRSALGLAGAWFFGILAPTSLAPGTTQMIVEHRTYLPLAAVLTVVVLALHRVVWRRAWVLPWMWTAAVLALVVVTVRRNEDYRSDIVLWTDTVAKRPGNALAHLMLAGAQERAGNILAALANYERTLELKPDFSIGYENLGQLLLRQSRRPEAIARFQSALRLQPDFADAHANLGAAYLAEGRISEAVGHLERAAQLTPASPVTHYNLGNALAAAGLAGEAVAEYQTALKLQPEMAEAHFNLANVLMELRRTPEAIAHYQRAVKARPGYAAAHYNLGNALAASGRPQDAVPHFEAALRARPDYAEVHHNLGSALFELGRLAEAAEQYEATLRLAPEFPNARENLARVRARMK